MMPNGMFAREKCDPRGMLSQERGVDIVIKGAVIQGELRDRVNPRGENVEICVFQGGSYAINILMQARANTHAMTGIMSTAAIGVDACERGGRSCNRLGLNG